MARERYRWGPGILYTPGEEPGCFTSQVAFFIRPVQVIAFFADIVTFRTAGGVNIAIPAFDSLVAGAVEQKEFVKMSRAAWNNTRTWCGQFQEISNTQRSVPLHLPANWLLPPPHLTDSLFRARMAETGGKKIKKKNQHGSDSEDDIQV